MDMSALLMIIQPTYIVYVALVYCMARVDNYQYFSSERDNYLLINLVNLKLIFMSESGPVLLVP